MAPATTAQTRPRRDEPEQRARARRAPARRRCPAAVPSSDIAPGVPGRTRGERRRQVRRAGPTPCRSRWRPCRCRPAPGRPRTPAAPRRGTAWRRPATRRDGGQARSSRTRCPRPRRPPRSSAMPSSAFRFSPRRDVTAAARNVANSRTQPWEPGAREDDRRRWPRRRSRPTRARSRRASRPLPRPR